MRHGDFPTDDRVTDERYDEDLDVQTDEYYTFRVPEDEAWEAAQEHHPALREDER